MAEEWIQEKLKYIEWTICYLKVTVEITQDLEICWSYVTKENPKDRYSMQAAAWGASVCIQRLPTLLIFHFFSPHQHSLCCCFLAFLYFTVNTQHCHLLSRNSVSDDHHLPLDFNHLPKLSEPHILLSKQLTLLCVGWKYNERSVAFILYTVKTGGGSYLFSMFKIKQIYAAFSD